MFNKKKINELERQLIGCDERNTSLERAIDELIKLGCLCSLPNFDCRLNELESLTIFYQKDSCSPPEEIFPYGSKKNKKSIFTNN